MRRLPHEDRIGKDAILSSPLSLAVICSQDLIGWQWRPTSYHLLLSSLITRGAKRLVVTAPFRSGKSEFLSFWLPLWVILRAHTYHNYVSVLLVSHTWMLARRHIGRLARVLHLLGLGDRPRAAQLDLPYATVMPVGSEGAIVGYGADWLIVDDAIRSLSLARSKNYPERQWEWFRTEAMSRLSPGGRAVVLGTRFAEDDLLGHLAEEPEWECYRIPAVALADDVLGRKEGEVLELPWVGDSRAYWAERRREVGERIWQQSYQGMPYVPTGEVIRADWLIPVERHGDKIEGPRVVEISEGTIVHGVDWAVSEGGGDYTAIATVLRLSDGTTIVLSSQSGQWPLHDAIERVVDRWEMDAGYVVAEATGMQKGFCDLLRQRHVAVVAQQAKGKAIHAESLAALAAAGKLWVCPGNDELVSQLVRFPGARHDDLLDALYYASLGGALRVI